MRRRNPILVVTIEYRIISSDLEINIDYEENSHSHLSCTLKLRGKEVLLCNISEHRNRFFDKVWHNDLYYKVKCKLQAHYYLLIKFYFIERYFRIMVQILTYIQLHLEYFGVGIRTLSDISANFQHSHRCLISAILSAHHNIT